MKRIKDYNGNTIDFEASVMIDRTYNDYKLLKTVERWMNYDNN